MESHGRCSGLAPTGHLSPGMRLSFVLKGLRDEVRVFMDEGLGFRDEGLGFRDEGLGFLGMRVWD